MKKLCIVPCGSKKIWKKNPNVGATEARNVYVGSFAKKCIEYAEKFHEGHYRILSAKYGLMLPDFIIPQDYNITFNKPSGNIVTIEKLKEQAMATGLKKEYREIIVLGGREYVLRIADVFDGYIIHIPLSKCKGMGYMMQELTKAIKKGEALI